MHKYEELERLYYKKKYTKYFFIFFSIVLLSLLIFFLTQNSDKNIQQKSSKVNKVNIEKKEINKTKEIIKEKNNSKKEIKKVKEVKQIKPELKQIKEVNKTKLNDKKIKQEVKKLVLYPIFPELNENKDKKEDKKEIKQQKSPKIEVNNIKKEEKKVALKIVVKSVKTTTDLIHIFEKSPTYDNAIKIAKIYFERKNYQKAVEWSKKANKIEPEKYESWYIFAKSLIKLGKVNKAKKVLIAYLNTYGPDKNIEKLLRSIK